MRACDLFYELSKAGALKEDFKLRPHQQVAIDKLLANKGSLLIAHGPGTGKTPTSSAAIEVMREKGMAGKALIVTPANLRDNFLDGGIHKFTTSKGIRLGPKGEAGSHHIDQATIPDADSYVVSVEMFRKDPHKYLDRTGADTIVWDEVHKLRDTGSSNYAAAMAVRSRVKNFVGLTGTPVMNHPRDIVPILDVITNKSHGLSGKGSDTFDKRYIGSEVKRVGPLAMFGIGRKEKHTVFHRQHELKALLGNVVHHVSTEDVAADMPKKKVVDVDVEMSKPQHKLYNFAMQKVDPITRWKIRNNLPVNTREAQHVFSMITQARQASNSLHVLDSTYDAARSAEDTPKSRRVLDDVHEHLGKNPTHKAIVYTNMVRGGVDQMVAGLKSRGHDPGVFIGAQQISKKERAQHVEDYLAGRKRVMVINTAGTEGLNLPGTTLHATLDGHFNPAVMEQAEARGIRAGSPVKEVEVRRYRSLVPKPFGVPFLPRETSTDQWIHGIADRKETLNKKFMGLMKSAALSGVRQ